MQARFDRLIRLMAQRYDEVARSDSPPAFALRLRDEASHVFGGAEPVTTIIVRNASGVAAVSSMDQLAFAEAYMAGDVDIEGDLSELLALRRMLPDRHPLRYLWRFVQPFLFGQVSRDRKWIARHYDHEQDFYLLFLDRRHRCYSQAVFEADGETLEDAMTRKLEFAMEAIGVGPGDRVLDIGGGWGAFTQFAGRRGVNVTSLTISEGSEKYLQEMIQRESLPCQVKREHFYQHRPERPYDAIVNLGVTEHLPDYRRTLGRYQELLVPGGRIYLDASAARVKYSPSTFLERYIYPGNGTFLCLHDYLRELARTPLQLHGVYDDRHSYALTTRHWAENLDRVRDEVVDRWGLALYRSFRLYLWGCVDLFSRDGLQAYRLVLAKPGARPRVNTVQRGTSVSRRRSETMQTA